MFHRIRTARTAATLIALTVVGALGGPPVAAAAPSSHAPLAPCDGAPPRVTGFAEAAAPIVGWRENLVFDGRGRMWVSNVVAGEVVGYDAAGQRVATVPVASPGGLAVTPTGDVAVVTGALLTSPRSEVLVFDPDDDPTARLIATLPAGKNGLASDSGGNLYTTGLQESAIIKLRPDGSVDHAWTGAAAIGGTNGIAIADGVAFVSATLAADTVIYEVPLDNPGAARPHVLTRLPEVPRALDDLAVTDDAIFAAGMTGGEILRVDRQTGSACVLASGIPGPTSVRVAEGFGGYGPGDLFVTSIDGQIRHVAAG